MKGRRKNKQSPPGEQFNLWDAVSPSHQRKATEVSRPLESSAGSHEQDKLDHLTDELAATKKELSQLRNQLKEAKSRKCEDNHAYLKKLVDKLPLLLFFEVLKAASLKETKEVVKPLKPTVGMTISTTRSIRELGATIGLSPGRTERALQLLSNAGFVKQRGLGALELGEFSQDQKGRIFPSWYGDIKNPEHIITLFSTKDTLS
jgi:hypothetical protein